MYCKKSWEEYLQKIRSPGTTTHVTGRDLDIASVVFVSRNAGPIEISQEALDRLNVSTGALQASLERGSTVYGVNTGFGGSADTRTSQVEELQRVLLRELHYGVLAPGSTPQSGGTFLSSKQDVDLVPSEVQDLQNGLVCENMESETCMPESWVRAAILVRINSLISGHSGVRPVVVERMVDLLRLDITPRVPVHGSISASGDLSPLSYIGGAICAKANLEVLCGPRSSGRRKCETAQAAFAKHGLAPVVMGAKETLAIVNGTAISCGVAVLALHDVQGLCMLSEVLTAMSVEALFGTPESFNPIFSKIRPHPGQLEIGQDIDGFLRGSKLAFDAENAEAGRLRQDRYSIRTVPQWLGPILEDLELAHQQLLIECNSVTDNPVIDESGRSWHGGNFQAKSVTSAMEKARQATQTIGQMLFAQSTEMINPTTNRGLPPNLVVDDPNLSFVMKAVDIQAAALLSELGFLANPVGSHVHTAEMGNQSLNSMALVSAKYTHTAANVLGMLSAGHVLAVCQALDLRALHALFLRELAPQLQSLLWKHLNIAPEGRESSEHGVTDNGVATSSEQTLGALYDKIWTRLEELLSDTTAMNADVRFEKVTANLQIPLLDNIEHSNINLEALPAWRKELSTTMYDIFCSNRTAYLANGDASDFLGIGSKNVYRFVRQTLKIPFLHTGLLRTPAESQDGKVSPNGTMNTEEDRPGPLVVGEYMTKVYRAIKSGAMMLPVMESLDAVSKVANGDMRDA